MKKNYFKKIVYTILFFSIPFICLIISYFIFDPFKVLFQYQNYYDDYFIEPNRDFVSVEKFLQNKDSLKYNSFLFGSSRLMAWRTDSWCKYINNCRAFHFDAYKDNIVGIYKKINLIDQQKIKIDNAILVIDYEIISHTEDTLSRLFIKHYIYSDYSKIKFHFLFFKEYFKNNFFIEYLDYKMFRKQREYMTQIDFNQKYADTYTNDFFIHNLDREIEEQPEKFYAKKNFYHRDTIQSFYQETILQAQNNILKEIKNIFDRHNTDYKIVISPNFEQKKLNLNDMLILYQIFDKQNIYDFSGINSLTNDITNYYDIYHYQPKVADSILRKIY